MTRISYITTCTPLRVSFAGGGTDLPEFYEREEGAVFSTAIDKHIFVTVKRLGPLFNENYRLNYSEVEQVDSLDKIKNNIARECLRLVPVEPPIYISTIADLPANSGLGSSSSFAVGLLKALHALREERVSLVQIVEEASKVEIAMLGRPIGKQDHFAAAFGGLNLISFQPNGRVSVEPQPLSADDIARLFGHILMFWTGITRDAGDILDEQKRRTNSQMDTLVAMRDQARDMCRLMVNGFDPIAFGDALHAGWEMKRSLASEISNSRIDEWYERARAAGAYGGKICGAGGGGFLLVFAPPERHPDIRRALSDLLELTIGYEPYGARPLIPVVE